MLRNLICLQHKSYNGSQPPVLSCKTCCKIYIDNIRGEQKRTIDKIEEIKKKQEYQKQGQRVKHGE